MLGAHHSVIVGDTNMSMLATAVHAVVPPSTATCSLNHFNLAASWDSPVIHHCIIQLLIKQEVMEVAADAPVKRGSGANTSAFQVWQQLAFQYLMCLPVCQYQERVERQQRSNEQEHYQQQRCEHCSSNV